MEYEEQHLQSTAIVTFTLKDGSIFGYKPMMAGEENDYMKDYMIQEDYIGEEGQKLSRRVEDITKVNMVKSYNLTRAPYKDWEKKTKEERWAFLRLLKPKIFSEIIKNINRIDKGDFKSKKNFSKPSEKE